ncbi:hypothetical protein Tco_1239471 [Tanacetum coccineum]
MAAVEVPQTLEYRGGQLNAALVLEDFQDSPDDEEDTRNSHEYLNDLEKEYQARALLAKSKRFFKKGTQKFGSAKATDQTKCHKCGKKAQPEPRLTKDFEAKYNKVKAKLTLISSSASAPSLSLGKNKGLIAETYDWDEEEVSSDDNEVTEVKALMAITDEEITDYDSADESLVCSTPLPPLEKLPGVVPVSGPKTIKSILKSKSTFKVETLKGITINEPSLAPWKRISDKRTKNQAKTDKTEHEMERRGKAKDQKVNIQVNPDKSQSQSRSRK